MPSSPPPQAGLRAVAIAAAATVVVAGASYLLWKRRHEQALIRLPRIVELWIYPVKGCRGIRVESALVGENGFQYDREWVILKNDGVRTVVTLRNCPKLALVRTAIDHDTKTLELSAEGKGSVHVPLDAPSTNASSTDSNNTAARYALWNLAGSATFEGTHIAKWLSDVLDMDVSLFRTRPDRDPHNDKEDFGLLPPSSKIRAHDFSHVMAMGTGTVEQIRQACGDATVDAHRFRPNIVFDLPVRAEDTFREMKGNGLVFFFSRFCTRCVVPSVRDDGTFHPRFEPTKTLREKFSSRALHQPTGKAQPIAGVQFFVTGAGRLNVGDELQVSQSGNKPNYGAETK